MPCNVVLQSLHGHAWQTLAMAAVALIAGCSTAPRMDYAKAGLVQVGGVVTFGGAPLANALVIFENPENGTFSFGRTDSAGRYSLMFDSVQPGVTKGRKTVRIRTSGSFGEGDPDARPAGGKELLPASYHADSKLVVEVSGPADDVNFDLSPTGR